MNQTRIATKRRRPGCLWRSRPPLRTPIKRPRLRVREYSLRGMTSPSRPPAPTALALFRFAVRRWGYCLRDTRRDVTADRPEDRRHHANGECHAEAYRVYGRVTGGCEGPRPPARGFALAPGSAGRERPVSSLSGTWPSGSRRPSRSSACRVVRGRAAALRRIIVFLGVRFAGMVNSPGILILSLPAHNCIDKTQTPCRERHGFRRCRRSSRISNARRETCLSFRENPFVVGRRAASSCPRW